MEEQTEDKLTEAQEIAVPKLSEEERSFQIKFKRLQIDREKARADMRDMAIERLEKEIEIELPNQKVKDYMSELKDLIERKKIKLGDGTEIDALPGDIEDMKLTLVEQEKKLELDLPMREAKFRLKDMTMARDSKEGSHEAVIKDLERDIKALERNHVAKENVPSMVA